MGSLRKLTDEQVVQIRQMYKDGMSYTQISETVGHNRRYVSEVVTGKKFAKAGNIPNSAIGKRRRLESMHGTLTPAQIADARRMSVEGHTLRQIGEFIGRNNSTVSQIVRGRSYRDSSGPIRSLKSQKEVNKSGSLSASAKLDEEDVASIKNLLLSGLTLKEIANQFEVNESLISQIGSGKIWGHVGVPLNLEKTRNGKKAPRGEKHWKAQLDELTVSYIKWHLSIGVACSLLAKYFKVSRSVITGIARGINWKHVKPSKSSPHRILAPERKIPIRLRGERLKSKIEEVKAARA
jgi:DNA-binding CsgD family transcriptional regulator